MLARSLFSQGASMAVMRGFLWLLGFLLLGDVLVTLTGLPVSAGVGGMLLLTFWLMLRGTVSRDITGAAQPLINVLAMLIMPGVVGVFFILDTLSGQWAVCIGALVGGWWVGVVRAL